MYLQICESSSRQKICAHKSQTRKLQKRLGPQTANPQIAIFAEGPLIYYIF